MTWKRNLGIFFVLASVSLVFVGLGAMLVGLFASATENAASGILTQSMILLPLSVIASLILLPWGTVWMYKNTASFSVGESLKAAHRLFVSRFWFWLGLLFFPMVLSLGFTGVSNYFKEIPLVYFTLQITSMVLGILLSFVLTRITIFAARGQMARLEDGWSSWGSLGKFFLGSVALILVTFLGTLLFIIPGIYLGLRYGYVPNLIAEKGMGVRAAFSESSRITQNAKMDLFAFALVGGVFMFLAMIPLYLGLIYVAPLLMLADAVIYVKLSERLA